jgi:hypothetical protein
MRIWFPDLLEVPAELPSELPSGAEIAFLVAASGTPLRAAAGAAA